MCFSRLHRVWDGPTGVDPFHLTMSCGHERRRHSPAPWDIPNEHTKSLYANLLSSLVCFWRHCCCKRPLGEWLGLLRNTILRAICSEKGLEKHLSQPIYGSVAKVCSKTKLNKLCNLFLLLIDSCSLGVVIFSFSLGLLFSIFENSFFSIFLHLKRNRSKKRSPWCSLLSSVSSCWRKADLRNHLVNLPGQKPDFCLASPAVTVLLTGLA